MKPGIYDDVSFDDYLEIDAVNQSLLKKMSRSASHCHAAMSEPDEPSKPMRFGKLLHAGKLEPLTVARLYTVMDPYELDDANKTAKGVKTESKNTTYYKTKVEEHKAANPGKEVVEQADFDQMVKMVQTIDADPDASRLFARGGTNEVTIVWVDEETGLLCKLRTDRLIQDEWPTILDLKKAANADEDWHNGVMSFPMQIGRIGYDVQAAWYVDGAKGATGKDTNFLCVAVEDNAACGMRIYDLTAAHSGEPSWADIGRRKYRPWLRQFAECKKTGVWPGYAKGITTPTIPAYEFDAAEVVA